MNTCLPLSIDEGIFSIKDSRHSAFSEFLTMNVYIQGHRAHDTLSHFPQWQVQDRGLNHRLGNGLEGLVPGRLEVLVSEIACVNHSDV